MIASPRGSSCSNPQLRGALAAADGARALLQLDALDFDRSVRPVIARNPPPPGTPYSWEWLIRRGAAGYPADPTSVPFEIDPVTGAVSVSPDRSCFRCLGLDRRNDR